MIQGKLDKQWKNLKQQLNKSVSTFIKVLKENRHKNSKSQRSKSLKSNNLCKSKRIKKRDPKTSGIVVLLFNKIYYNEKIKY